MHDSQEWRAIQKSCKERVKYVHILDGGENLHRALVSVDSNLRRQTGRRIRPLSAVKLT
jgi:hypothetical protein